MVKTVDIHSHIVPAEFPSAPVDCCGHWPQMEHHTPSTASVMIDGREFRKLDNRSWDINRRLSDMDTEDVRLQVLSPMPELLSYWMDTNSACQLCRHINGSIASMIAGAPDRFAGLGMVPMQDPALAARELERLKSDGLQGIEIGSNILGRSPGDAFFDPVYAEAERLNLAIFIHALRPTTNDRLVGPVPPLAAFIGFPVDVGLAAASLITGRTLEKFPKLRIACSHGGGVFSAILPRLQNGWVIAPDLNDKFRSPSEMARQLYYDNVVFDKPTLRHLIDLFGDTQLLAGSDYPYLAGQSFPGRAFAELDLSSDRLERMLAGNALQFLGL